MVEVPKVDAQDRFLLLHPLTHLVLRMRFLQGVSHFSPSEQSARVGPHSGSELSADFTPSALADLVGTDSDDDDGLPMWPVVLVAQ